jgi:hypothetical protein
MKGSCPEREKAREAIHVGQRGEIAASDALRLINCYGVASISGDLGLNTWDETHQSRLILNNGLEIRFEIDRIQGADTSYNEEVQVSWHLPGHSEGQRVVLQKVDLTVGYARRGE